MGLFGKKYQVKQNTVGFLFRDNTLEKELSPGIYKIRDWGNRTELITLPTTAKLLTITNQEVLTKDNIALRFSFSILYKIADGEKFLQNFPLNKDVELVIFEAEQRLHQITQVFIRQKIAELESEELNEKRNEISDFKTQEMDAQVAELGIEIKQARLRDITFPKSIQDLFAKQLEAKIRSKTELENARTAVATARALKNASALMKDDENIKFFQIIETISKIADKGKHTFVIGDMDQLGK